MYYVDNLKLGLNLNSKANRFNLGTHLTQRALNLSYLLLLQELFQITFGKKTRQVNPLSKQKTATLSQKPILRLLSNQVQRKVSQRKGIFLPAHKKILSNKQKTSKV